MPPEEESPRLVALDCPPGAPTAAALAEIWARGDAALPLPAGLPSAEQRALVAALRPQAVRDGDGEHRLEGGAPAGPGVRLVVATSGSSGPPKGVELTGAALDAAAQAGAARLGLDAAARWLCCLPLHHVAGVLVLLRAALTDHEPAVHPGFDAAAVAAEPAVDVVALVPTMLHRLLAAGADLTRFRAILLGGAAAGPELVARARDAGAQLVQSYGMTETCGGCVYDGAPLAGMQVESDDEGAADGAGRIWVRGPMVMRGYRQPDGAHAPAGPGACTLAPDGWLRTPDRGRWRAGRLEIVGRADDVVITGGENVSLSEVAELLSSHPAVAAAAVTARPDPEWGQQLVAHVVPAGGQAPPSLQALRAHVREHAAAHKAPAALELVDALPRTALGKVATGRLGDQATTS